MSRHAIARVNVNRWKPWLSRDGSLQTVIFRTRRNWFGELHSSLSDPIVCNTPPSVPATLETSRLDQTWSDRRRR